ncbi:MAG: DnaJ domain-containing protein [Pseudomonadota bacterium]|nr:DnaJ domain-containing protein [Pseudomonadota bacterium]
MRFLKYLLLIVLGIIAWLISLVFKGTRKTVDIGVDAYKSVKHSESFDEAYKNFTSNQYTKTRLSIPEEIIALMAKIAKSDGKISQLEIEFMSDTIKSMTHAMKQAGLPDVVVLSAKKKLFLLANKAKKDENPISYYCQTLSESGFEVRAGAMMQMISFASLDGLSENTLAMLFDIGRLMTFTDEQVQQLIDQVNGQKGSTYSDPKMSQDPYAVLGCNESDDFSTIKKAYRKMVKQNHPDFMHGQGMDDAEIKAATEKMQDINAAFEDIKQRKGQ